MVPASRPMRYCRPIVYSIFFLSYASNNNSNLYARVIVLVSLCASNSLHGFTFFFFLLFFDTLFVCVVYTRRCLGEPCRIIANVRVSQMDSIETIADNYSYVHGQVTQVCYRFECYGRRDSNELGMCACVCWRTRLDNLFHATTKHPIIMYHIVKCMQSEQN